jgi:hypothetical protein
MTNTDDRCNRCPTSPDIRCRGLDVHRFCELIDPSRDRYDPRYRDVIVDDSTRFQDLARLDAAYAAHGTAALPGGCGKC